MIELTPDTHDRISTDIGINNKYDGQLVYCIPRDWGIYFKQGNVQEDTINMSAFLDPTTLMLDYNRLIILCAPLIFKHVLFLF